MTMQELKTIPYVDLPAQHRALQSELIERLEKVVLSGRFILGDEVREFEERFADYCGAPHACGVGNGTDGLTLALRLLDIGTGDEVIVPPNSFIASASSVALVGAKPVFADVRDDFNIDPAAVERAVTSRTKAIMPVHLTGRPADMDAILAVARKNNLYVIEDAAQAAGARYRDRGVGTFGIFGVFSMHPLKNLGASGDAGMVVTGDKRMHERLLKARNHGLRNRDECEFWAPNSRLDALQAAVLNVKMSHVEKWNEIRRQNASDYAEKLRPVVRVPEDLPHELPVYEKFVIQSGRRDQLQVFLRERGIESAIHYPVPIHLQEAARSLGYREGDMPVTERQAREILSLPSHQWLTREEQSRVTDTILEFFSERS